jgi:hypothetical protein
MAGEDRAEFTELSNLNHVLGQLFGFARARDEIDFAMSLAPEFCGSQDAGWNTAEEAQYAFKEGLDILNQRQCDRAAIRNLLYRYLFISEAGGLYEIIRNQIGIIGSDIYKLWPFQDIVERHAPSGKIKAPNANRIFRELSQRAEEVGLTRLSGALAEVFDDDLRNAIAHADFIIWDDGIRLRKRNGGHPYKLSWAQLNRIVRRGFCFVDLLNQYTEAALRSYEGSKEIVGRGSANKIPFRHTIEYSPHAGFSISTKSPGGETSPEFVRTEAIKSILGKQVLVIVSWSQDELLTKLEEHYRKAGIEPFIRLFPSQQEHTKFVDELVSSHPDIFIESVPESGAKTIIVTPLGATEALETKLDVVLPFIPEFTIDAQKKNSPPE